MNIQVELLFEHMRDLRLDHIVARYEECRPVFDFLATQFASLITVTCFIFTFFEMCVEISFLR